MTDTKIEWTDAVWNPLRGCSKVSEGCRNCYAIKQANRFSGPGMPYEGLTEKTAAGVNWTGKVMLVPEKLAEPLKWKEPKRIFVNSMSDLFHKEVPDDFIDLVFAVMALATQHTFQILTKRPERMQAYVAAVVSSKERYTTWAARGSRWMRSVESDRISEVPARWPLPNVWIGVSVENQKAADERIPLLLQTPAAVRFLSCEPLLGEVSLQGADQRDGGSYRHYLQYIDWVITGGESGPGARPVHPDWIRSLRDQCQAAGVAFHFKQWGEWAPLEGPLPKDDSRIDYLPDNENPKSGEYTIMYRIGKSNAGRLLDGREWNEFPEVSD